MVYIMSDIHGQYAKYKRMLEKIEFSDADDLYVLGDIIDRGPEPVELLLDMSMRMNVFPILGNHDMMAAMLLRKLCIEITEDNYATHIDPETIKSLAMWQMDGGQATLEGFKRLSPDERVELIEYIEDFSPYEILEVNGRRFILVHGGIVYEKRDVPLSKQPIGELITERPDYTKRYYNNAYLVTGHTPTLHIGDEFAGKIYQQNGHIALDCGAGFDMPLGCIRLDDLQTFYAE